MRGALRIARRAAMGATLALVAFGCDGDDDGQGGAGGTAEGEEESASAGEAPLAEDRGEDTEGEGSAGGSLDDIQEIGVDVCDDYVETYLRCISENTPQELSAEYVEAFVATQEAWKVDVQDEDARAQLVETCTRAAAAARESTRPYGCEW